MVHPCLCVCVCIYLFAREDVIGIIFVIIVYAVLVIYVIILLLLQRESIVEIFYEKHLGQLIDAITSSCQPNDAAQTSSKFVSSGGGNGNQRGVRPEILLSICDLLCFCVLHHPYRIK